MPISECISSSPLGNGDTLYYGRQKMIIPAGGGVVRQCSFFIPSVAVASPDSPGAKCTPVIVATVDNHPGVGAGTIMGIFDITVAQVDDTTEVKITAVHVTDSTPLDGDYFCNVTIIGTPTGRRHKV
jgi:hypothetical protein